MIEAESSEIYGRFYGRALTTLAYLPRRAHRESMPCRDYENPERRRMIARSAAVRKKEGERERHRQEERETGRSLSRLSAPRSRSQLQSEDPAVNLESRERKEVRGVIKAQTGLIPGSCAKGRRRGWEGGGGWRVEQPGGGREGFDRVFALPAASPRMFRLARPISRDENRSHTNGESRLHSR